MNIPILDKEVNEFRLVRAGKTSVGLDNYHILCDEMEFPVDGVESFSVFMDSENAKVTIKTCTRNPAVLEINARKIFIDGYAANGAEMARRLDEKRIKEAREADRRAAEDEERLKQAAAKLRETLRGAEESARAFAETVTRDCNS